MSRKPWFNNATLLPDLTDKELREFDDLSLTCIADVRVHPDRTMRFIELLPRVRAELHRRRQSTKRTPIK